MNKWALWADEWELRDKVSFDGPNKLILINEPETVIQVREDIYSAWKRWVLLYDNAKYLPAIRTIGGDPTVSGQRAGDLYFLINGWQIRTWEADHQLQLIGAIFNDTGQPVFKPTIFNHNIQTVIERSSLVTTVVSEVEGQLGQSDKDEIVDRLTAGIPTEVWRHIHDPGYPAGSYGQKIDAIEVAAFILRKGLTNRFVIQSGQLILYDDDDVTVLRSWNLNNNYGITAQAVGSIKTDEIHKIHGLKSGAPLTVGKTSREVDDITQTITENVGTGDVTIARD